MSVRMRHTRGQTGSRRAHHALAALSVVKDKESGNARLPHRLDEATGMYRGKQILAPRAKKEPVRKAKGPNTEPAPAHAHEHAHEVHTNADVKGTKGFLGKVFKASRPKARSGMGGQAG